MNCHDNEMDTFSWLFIMILPGRMRQNATSYDSVVFISYLSNALMTDWMWVIKFSSAPLVLACAPGRH